VVNWSWLTLRRCNRYGCSAAVDHRRQFAEVARVVVSLKNQPASTVERDFRY
jgi:hypothetical protein